MAPSNKEARKRPELKRTIALCATGMVVAAFAYLVVFHAPIRAGDAPSQLNTASDAGGPGYIMLHPATFHSHATYAYTLGPTELSNVGGASVYLYAPVQLPDGARVKRLTYHCRNTGSGQGGVNEARLLRTAPASFDGSYDAILSAVSEGLGDDTVVDNTPLSGAAVVDNSQYAYVVEIHFHGGLRQQAFGVRIDYAYADFLPAVLKE